MQDIILFARSAFAKNDLMCLNNAHPTFELYVLSNSCINVMTLTMLGAKILVPR